MHILSTAHSRALVFEIVEEIRDPARVRYMTKSFCIVMNIKTRFTGTRDESSSKLLSWTSEDLA